MLLHVSCLKYLNCVSNCSECFKNVFQTFIENHSKHVWKLFKCCTYCLKITLKKISSPYCAVSEPNVYKHYKRLTRWNANRCYSLRITYLSLRPFKLFFQQLHWFLQLWRFSSSNISGRMKHKASLEKWRLTWKFEFTSCK